MELVDDFTPSACSAHTTRAPAAQHRFGRTVRQVMGRWDALRPPRPRGRRRLATAAQVHGAQVIVHVRVGTAGSAAPGDGTRRPRADRDSRSRCRLRSGLSRAPVRSGRHPPLRVRGTAARIVEQGIAALAHRGFRRRSCVCTWDRRSVASADEVSPDVIGQLTGESTSSPRTVVSGRSSPSTRARWACGYQHFSWCTRHDNTRFFSHRAGMWPKVSVIFAAP